MTHPVPPNSTETPAASDATPTSGQPVRSEGLLPADDADQPLEVAEEVNLDQQSDGARRVGALPDDTPVSKPADALAETLRPALEGESEEPGQASGKP